MAYHGEAHGGGQSISLYLYLVGGSEGPTRLVLVSLDMVA